MGSEMCIRDRIGVSRNAYYNYRSSRAKGVSSEDQEMMDWICEFDKSSKNSYGSRRMKRALNALGYSISRQKARRLMKKVGVIVRNRMKYKVTTNSNHKQPVFDNLVSRQFDVDKKDSVYAGDITYLDTGRLAISGGRVGSVFPQSGRLEHELKNELTVGL